MSSDVAVRPDALTEEQLALLAGESQSTREDFGSEDVALPFLTILQSLSPQLKKSKPEYIQGAEEGDIVNTVTGELFKNLDVVVARYQRRYVEWKPRDQGGGLVRDYGSDPTRFEASPEGDTGVRITSDGNEIAANATYFLIHRTDTGWTPAILSMASTQWRKARRWNALITGFQVHGTVVPCYRRIYTLSTAEESNASGTWYGWQVSPGRLLVGGSDEKIVEQALQLREMAMSVKQAVHTPGGTSAAAGGKAVDDDIPF